MPLGFECRRDLLKQVPLKPTIRIGNISAEQQGPGPQSIALPTFIGGNGYSHIRRAPAYTFGTIPADMRRPATNPGAALLSISGVRAKDGKYRITHGVMSGPPRDLVRAPMPGPSHYRPLSPLTRPRAARYSLRAAAPPPYSSPDSWSPGANMYWPSCGWTVPVHTFEGRAKDLPKLNLPGPGAYNQNYAYLKRTEPSFSHRVPHPLPDLKKHVPAPNVHCDKKFKSVLRSIPRISFGIKHSPYAPGAHAYLMSEKLAAIECNNRVS